MFHIFTHALRAVTESLTASPPREGNEIAVQEYATNAVALTVDRDAYVIRKVKILGTVSANGRQYPRAVLEAARDKYEGAKVNVGHGAQPTTPRDYRDRLGAIRNVTVHDDGLYGDLHYNAKHAVAEQLAWDAEHNPAAVGLSPAHFCHFRRQGNVEVAERIARVISVDLVGDPATTRGLFEHAEPAAADHQTPPPAAAAIESVEQLAAAYPDLLQSVVEETTRMVKVNVAAALKALMAAQLPYNAWDNGMLDAIVVSESAEAAEALIRDRAALVAAITEQLKTPTAAPPRIIAPPKPSPARLDPQTFAARLKQR